MITTLEVLSIRLINLLLKKGDYLDVYLELIRAMKNEDNYKLIFNKEFASHLYKNHREELIKICHSTNLRLDEWEQGSSEYCDHLINIFS